MTYYVLSCRLCDESEEFSTVDEINSGNWSEVSKMGAHYGKYVEHKGYCPGHSLDP